MRTPTVSEVGRGKPPKHSQFKKGQSGNPRGAQLHDQTAKQIRKLTSEEVREVATLILDNNLPGLQAIARDKTASVLKVWIASIAAKGIQKGDPSALDKILERLIGKVKQDVSLSDPNGNPLVAPQVVVYLPSNGREDKE